MPRGWLLSLAAATLASGADTRLAEAAQQGNRDAVRALIRGRAPVNDPQADGMTALHWAARSNDLEMARTLMAAKADVKAASRYGITPLWLAAANGSAAMTELLLNSGADANARLPKGETVLMAAARSGDAATVRLLLRHGADPNAAEESMGETALMWAAAENHPGAVTALIEGGADKNARSKVLTLAPFQWETSGMVSTTLPRGGWTALMYAARQNSLSAARALADAGADLNVRDPDGTTALVFAIINAHFDLAAMLADKGADPNIADESGMAALYAAVDMHTLGPMISRPAPKLVDEIDAAGMVKVLLAHGADPNQRLKKPVIGRHHDGGDASLGEGTTPLFRAAKTNDVPVMRMLLEAGASPFLTQKDYSTVLMVIAAGGARAGAYSAAFSVTEEGAIEAMKLCIDYGADVNAFNANGQTALHRAAQRGANKIVQFLADAGAKLDMKDKQGRTPLDLVSGAGPGGRGAGGGRESTANLLRQLMAGRAK
jgi:ankyrin repeat protein